MLLAAQTLVGGGLALRVTNTEKPSMSKEDLSARGSRIERGGLYGGRIA